MNIETIHIRHIKYNTIGIVYTQDNPLIKIDSGVFLLKHKKYRPII